MAGSLKQTLLLNLLPLVPFEGWTDAALAQAAKNASLDPREAIRAFPRGGLEALTFYSGEADREMAEALRRYNLETMKIRERIALAVTLRLDQQLRHREAVRRGVAMLSLPLHMGQALRMLYRTVDAIWHAIGDHSTDFNFYTKRGILAGVYISTVLIWLDDSSPVQEETRLFLARRIEM